MHCTSIFNAISEPALILDLENRILEVNQTTTSALGISADKLVGKYCYEIFHCQPNRPTECPCAAMLATNMPQSCPMTVERLNEIHMVTVSPIYNENGTIEKILHITRDMTKQLQAEESLKKVQQAKEESIKTIAEAISHRLNNAMTVIQGNLKLLIHSLPDTSNEHRLATDTAQAAAGVSLVSSTLQNSVGQQSFHLKPALFSSLIDDCLFSLKDILYPSVAVTIIPNGEQLLCKMDPKMIKEVLSNIITNAVDSFDAEHGSIEISFGTDYFTDGSFPEIFQDKNHQHSMYTFCQIKDNGHGIEAKNMPRIFEPFYTTHLVGRGLGLALTAGIMRNHHGAVQVESTPGKGTVVKLLLPVSPEIQQANEQEAIIKVKDIGINKAITPQLDATLCQE